MISPILVFRLIIHISSKSNTVNKCKTNLGYPKHIFIAIVIISIGLGMIAGIIGWNLFIEVKLHPHSGWPQEAPSKGAFT